MPETQRLLELLSRARNVMDRYLIDPETEAMRDDLAEVMLAIDDVMPDDSRVVIKAAAPLARALDEVAA